MSIAGNIYGVVLNDVDERTRLQSEFEAAPYKAPPLAPVVYMKPRSAVTFGPVRIARGDAPIAAPTVALLIARDVTKSSESDVWGHVGGCALAIDLSLPKTDYYRPAVSGENRDGYLALGEWTSAELPERIDMSIDKQPVFGWKTDRLLRSPVQLIAELSKFMTLKAGDVLLIGLPGDAPAVRAGQTLIVTAPGLPALKASIMELSA